MKEAKEKKSRDEEESRFAASAKKKEKKNALCPTNPILLVLMSEISFFLLFVLLIQNLQISQIARLFRCSIIQKTFLFRICSAPPKRTLQLYTHLAISVYLLLDLPFFPATYLLPLLDLSHSLKRRRTSADCLLTSNLDTSVRDLLGLACCRSKKKPVQSHSSNSQSLDLAASPATMAPSKPRNHDDSKGDGHKEKGTSKKRQQKETPILPPIPSRAPTPEKAHSTVSFAFAFAFALPLLHSSLALSEAERLQELY